MHCNKHTENTEKFIENHKNAYTLPSIHIVALQTAATVIVARIHLQILK